MFLLCSFLVNMAAVPARQGRSRLEYGFGSTPDGYGRTEGAKRKIGAAAGRGQRAAACVGLAVSGIYPHMGSPCYCASLRAAARKATALYDATLAPAGVNVAQFALLRKIERAESVSLTELGRLAALDRSTVGRNVKVLERLGLVQVAAAEDQREAAVALTPAGAEALVRAAPHWEEAQRHVEAALGTDGAHALRTLANKL